MILTSVKTVKTNYRLARGNFPPVSILSPAVPLRDLTSSFFMFRLVSPVAILYSVYPIAYIMYQYENKVVVIEMLN